MNRQVVKLTPDQKSNTADDDEHREREIDHGIGDVMRRSRDFGIAHTQGVKARVAEGGNGVENTFSDSQCPAEIGNESS